MPLIGLNSCSICSLYKELHCCTRLDRSSGHSGRPEMTLSSALHNSILLTRGDRLLPYVVNGRTVNLIASDPQGKVRKAGMSWKKQPTASRARCLFAAAPRAPQVLIRQVADIFGFLPLHPARGRLRPMATQEEIQTTLLEISVTQQAITMVILTQILTIASAPKNAAGKRLIAEHLELTRQSSVKLDVTLKQLQKKYEKMKDGK